MNWKVILVSCVAFFLILVLLYFKVIGTDVGIVTSIAALIGVFSPILNHLLKPKVSLTVSDLRLEKTEYGDVEGYKIRTRVSNKGNKIAFNLTASVQFSEQVKFLRVDIEKTDDHETYKISEDTLKENDYSWIDNDGKAIESSSLDKLRKDDTINLLFPKKLTSGGWFISNGVHSYSSAHDTLLKLGKGKSYQILITLKGEDHEKNTVIKTEKFKIKVGA